MAKLLAIGFTLAAVAAWLLRDSPGFGEWLRRVTDGPSNLVLIGTSGFEREGRDPAKGA